MTATSATQVTPATVNRAHTLREEEARANAPIRPGTYCDQCRVARAYARAIVNGTALHFCGHHLRDHRQALEANPAILLHVEDVKP